VNNKVSKVFWGWLNLTEGERQELDQTVRRYLQTTDSERRALRESVRDSVTKLVTGPLGSGGGSCPCCGR
jgi:hypothetical protein